MKFRNIFLDKSRDILARTVPDLYQGIRKDSVAIHKLSGGVNSSVYKMVIGDQRAYCVKKYARRPGDRRSRLKTEFEALTFLWGLGIRNIAQPLFADEARNIAIYRFIEGEKIAPGRVSLKDVESAALFAKGLHELRLVKGARKMPVASEACFSLDEYLFCVRGRIKRLKSVKKSKDLAAYLNRDIAPFFESISQSIKIKARRNDFDPGRVLRSRDRTLSLSDFGFHNAIKSRGRIYFVDLEYFGWDDPAKLIADFFLQPAVPVPESFRKEFYGILRPAFTEGQSLEKRIDLVYPLLGLKWALIMLNAFFDAKNSREILAEQLTKSKRKLEESKNDHGWAG